MNVTIINKNKEEPVYDMGHGCEKVETNSLASVVIIFAN